MVFFSSIDYNDFLWSLERSLVKSPVVSLKLHVQPTQTHLSSWQVLIKLPFISPRLTYTFKGV